MKPSPASPFTKRGTSRGAFTLIELLVAMAVVALIIALVSQVIAVASQTWLNGQSRASNFITGRSMLDLLARDLQNGLFRNDLPAFPAGTIAFYTERPGYSTGSTQNRNVSWVRYELGNDSNAVLRRADLALDWGTSLGFGSSAAPSGAVLRDTAGGIVAFKVQFISSNGLISPTYDAANRPKAISVSLAVVDDKTLERLGTNVTTLHDALSSYTTGTDSAKADWERGLNGTFPWDHYPKRLATGLKIFERYVTLR